MEHIREKIAYLGTAIEKYDGLVKDLAETRWVVEMVRLQAQLEINTQKEANQKALGSLEHTKDQLARSERVLLKLTNQDTVESARKLLVQLVSAYTRYSALEEAMMIVELGGIVEFDNEKRSNLLYFEQQQSAVKLRLEQLAGQIEVPPPSVIELI